MMSTEIHPDPVRPAAAQPRRRPPTPVIAAFYLWWPLIIGQSIMLAYLALTLVQAARIGGPAWDVLFVDPPIAVPLLLMITLEVAFAISMRGGSRLARTILIALAAVTVAFAFLVPIPDNGTQMPVVQTTAEVLAASVPFDLSLVLKLLAVIALVASVLPFVPAANSYFQRDPRPVMGDIKADVHSTISIPRSRRRMPWQVLIAFILWWPLILIEAVALFLVGRQMAYYLGLGMGSVVTVMFAVGVALPLLCMIAAEVTLVFFLRRGSPAARRWLLCLAIPTALLAIWPVVAVLIAEVVPAERAIPNGSLGVGIASIGGLIATLALAASILPYLRPGNRFFHVPPLTGSVGFPAPIAEGSGNATDGVIPGTPAVPPVDADADQRRLS